jgi:hypothetical protein
MSPEIIEVKYALDTFYFLISGVLVMWMAAGFAMLEAGLVRTKNTAAICLKNIAIYSVGHPVLHHWLQPDVHRRERLYRLAFVLL